FAILSYTYGYVTADLISVVHVANKGEMLPITVQLNNPTIFPVSNLTIYLTYMNSFSSKKYKKELSVSLDRKSKTNVTCNIFSEYSGNLEISISGIRLYDYMKIFSFKKKQNDGIKVAILPYFHEIAENFITNRSRSIVESDYFSQVKSGDDPSEVFAIREYREGDRPQRIHWKLSVKQDQLMIKDFSDPLNCSVLTFVDFSIPKGRNKLVYMDALLECAASLSYSFLSKGQIHYFSWFDAKHGVCRRIRVMQEKDLFEVLDGLLQAAPFTKDTGAFTAYMAEHPNDQYTDLFYVAGEMSDPQFDSMSMVRANAKNMIYLSNDGYDSDSDSNDQSGKHSPSEYMKNKTMELGIDLLPVDIGNLKASVEQLRLV
ncbi:MAG TPA: DUF58 domain-containing protein, partial [Mobilitalea sp.]|nr:DUF58 domain-containing protein [Mobilitalea sp.]